MLNWIATFLLLAVITAIFGFAGWAGAFGLIAQSLAGLFVVLFVASLIYSLADLRFDQWP